MRTLFHSLFQLRQTGKYLNHTGEHIDYLLLIFPLPSIASAASAAFRHGFLFWEYLFLYCCESYWCDNFVNKGGTGCRYYSLIIPVFHYSCGVWGLVNSSVSRRVRNILKDISGGT
uniref:G_PROTEIN_RECEP_F1_2 domain-containing protein n=1 Tax=Steinernema glaseri TaxID=37863 RepID=A0A1I7ZZ98_9BILA